MLSLDFFAFQCQVSKLHQQPVIHTTELLLSCNVIISSLSFLSNLNPFFPCAGSFSTILGNIQTVHADYGV